jgi:hypothetical protein
MELRGICKIEELGIYIMTHGFLPSGLLPPIDENFFQDRLWIRHTDLGPVRIAASSDSCSLG